VKRKAQHRSTSRALLIGIAFVASMVVSATAFAQSIVAVEHAIDGALALEDHIHTASRNLTQMLGALTGSDVEAAHIVLSARNEFHGAYSEVVTVGQLLMEMKSAEDQSIARQYFRESSRQLVEAADEDVDYINKFLPDIHSAAVLAEATKIRDSMIGMRAIFAPFAAKAST